jgi:MATE family multidrug resistance protein
MSIYTKDEQIKHVMRDAWLVICVFVFFDCMQGVANGGISGLGLIGKVKIVTIISYWVLGIPISIYCMFSLHLGIAGLWVGPTVAVTLNYLVYHKVIISADWQLLSDQILQKIKKENANLK